MLSTPLTISKIHLGDTTYSTPKSTQEKSFAFIANSYILSLQIGISHVPPKQLGGSIFSKNQILYLFW